MTTPGLLYDLVVRRGAAAGTSHPLPEGMVVVGRSSSCDITIDDPEISRQHLYISTDHRGVRVRDAGSLNGTTVGGRAITEEASVEPGITITIGETVLSIELALPPDRVHIDELPSSNDEWLVAIGLGPHRRPVRVDLTASHLVVVGPYRSGRTNALAATAAGARRLSTPPAVDLLALRPSRLTESSSWRSLVVGRDDVELALAASGGLTGHGEKTLVLIDDADELFDDDNVEFEKVLRQTRQSPVRFVIAAETKAAHACFGGWFLEARKHRHAIVLQPDPVLDGHLFGVDLPDRPPGQGPGRGYLIEEEVVSAVQIATDL